MESKEHSTIDEYIRACPKPVQARLKEIRRIIHEAAPEAQERISYKMPAFTLDGNLVYFAAFANHIGFYPIPSGIEKFKAELSKFKTSKGGIQFPLDEPLPGELIRKIVVFRAAENRKKMSKKSS